MTRIHFNEVATRDGFQIEPALIPTDVKVALVDELSGCGYAKIEVTSFTSPKAIPMLRDAEEVMGRIRRVPGVEYTVLVPNLRGAERALESRADELNLVMSTSETHNLANLRMPREHSFAALAEVIRVVDGRTPINVSLSTCFGCPMEGEVPPEVVLGFARRFADLGVRGLTICDTTGMAHPAQVARLVEALQKEFAALQLTLHFHNTRGMGLANVLAAVQGRHRPALTARWAVWAAARTHRAPAATSAAKTRSTCSTPWDLTPASTCTVCWPMARQMPADRRPRRAGAGGPQAGRITDLHPAPAPVCAELKAETFK
jgi:hydroxymethylglutaryl-CoA lyase